MQDEQHTDLDHAPFVKEEPANASMEGEYNIDDAPSPYYVCTDHTTSRDEDDLTEVTPITQPDYIETTTFSIIAPEVLPLPGTQTGTTKDNAVVRPQTHNPSSSLTENEVPKKMEVKTVKRRKGQQQTAPRERKIREKKHQCGLCNYAGQSLGHLRRHMMVHTGEKPHLCSYCDFKTAKKYTLQQHIFNRHKKAAEQNLSGYNRKAASDPSILKCGDAVKDLECNMMLTSSHIKQPHVKPKKITNNRKNGTAQSQTNPNSKRKKRKESSMQDV